MKFKIDNNLTRNKSDILRKVGYKIIFDRKTGKQSFVRNLTGGRYPRFHLYLKENSSEIIFDLHLDQTKTIYSGQTAHNAEYNSPEVKKELSRIYQEIRKWAIKKENNKQAKEENSVKQKPAPQKKNRLKRFLGL